MFMIIDEAADKAQLQDAGAVTLLVNILTAPGASESAQEHVMRVVADKARVMEEKDGLEMEKSGLNNAVTALWPKNPEADNRESYSCIEELVQKQVASLFAEATVDTP